MTALPESDVRSDAELAVAAANGDRAAFAGIYDRYADRLHDFCIGMLRDRNAAADCVQDTFCTAATRLDSLRDPDKLRPWLYSIARNEALRCLRERRREQPSDELPEATSSEPTPEALAARSELAALVAQAAGGLSERDREVLDLTYRHGLDGPELAEALGVSAASARTLTHRLRETVERSLGALLVMRSARAGHGCPDLAASVKDWDGQFTVLTRKRVARHIDGCLTCEASRSNLVSREALLGGAPMFIPAPAALRKRTMDRVQLCSASTALPGAAAAVTNHARAERTSAADVIPAGAAGTDGETNAEADGAAAPTVPALSPEDVAEERDKRRRRGLLLLFGLLALALFAALWFAITWPFTSDAPTAPAGVTATSSKPAPTSAAATTSTPPPPTTTTTPVAPPVLKTTFAGTPRPSYRPQPTQQYVPPAPAPESPAPPPSAAPETPWIRPTYTPPAGPIPAVPHAVPSGSAPHTGGSSGSGPSAPAPSGGSTSGGSTSGGGTSGGGTTGGGATGGTTGGGLAPGDTSGGTGGGTGGSTGPPR